MEHNVYLYIAVVALVTYLIRVLPLTLIRREIKNPFLRSFLYYVPYVTLAAMTFPAIFFATDNLIASAAGAVTAIVLSLCERKMITVALGSILVTALCLFLF